MEDKLYACILDTPVGKVFYSFGKEGLTTGLTDNDSYQVVECDKDAYAAACDGLWEEIEVKDGKVVKGHDASPMNENPPVVIALIPGRDF